jgi:hypothetical protein
VAKPKRKKRKPSAGQTSGESANSKTNGEKAPLFAPPPKDRHKLVALVMASLVAGLLGVINLDRVTHASNENISSGGSHHGWPLVYLKRELKVQPMIFISGRTHSWPLPAIEGETRDFSMANLGADVLICLLAVLIVYFIISTVVWRYDKWKYKY